jgi:hypothetical protein
VFFSVRDRLQFKGYVMHQVIQWHANTPPDLGKIWKFFAYRGGPVVLEALIHGLPPANKPAYLSEVVPFLTKDACAAFDVKAMVANHLEPVNASTAGRIIQRYLKLQQRAAKDKRQQGSDWMADNKANIQAALEALPWNQPALEWDPEVTGQYPPK